MPYSREIRIKTEYIRLDQLLKYSGLALSGSEAKEMILSGSVFVNGGIETRRGRKVRPGDTVALGDRISDSGFEIELKVL